MLQGAEPADFLALFSGRMLVTEPERAVPKPRPGCALYRVHDKGEGREEQSFCVQVRCASRAILARHDSHWSAMHCGVHQSIAPATHGCTLFGGT